MANKKLGGYRGRLTPAQTADGMNAAAQNARRLAEDAHLLLEANRFPSAASLAILSIEESGKVSILRRLAVAKDGKEIADCWRDYRSHAKKNAAWLLPQLVSDGARRLDDLRPLFDGNSDHPYILDQVKQIGFYTDCLGMTHWSIPKDVVDENLAKALVQVANMLANDRETTQKEIELWIKHLAPVWNDDKSLIERALIDWFEEVQEAGLAPEGENAMETFIYRGLSAG